LTRIENFKAIEGIASDVRQARTAIISNSGFIVAWGNSYECLCRLSGTPVALRVSGPIFIEAGETVRVVGRQNWNGVFEAVAYHNQSSGASGNSDQALAQRLFDKFTTTICVLGMTLLVVGGITSSLFIHGISDLLFVVCAFFGLLLVIGLRMFVRHRSETRTIASLLNDSHAFQPFSPKPPAQNNPRCASS
jgi:hypothetical protein